MSVFIGLIGSNWIRLETSHGTDEQTRGNALHTSDMLRDMYVRRMKMSKLEQFKK